MKTRIIYVDEGENSCPADALMADFRHLLCKSDYSKNIEFSESCIDFFKEMADVANETEDNIYFAWAEVPESELPPLEVKVAKREGKYFLNWLKEHGEEKTSIKAKSRKGKNKGTQEKLIIIKRTIQKNNEIEEDMDK